jgi:Tfp pilus assembly pilus retraction ATPase PilT
MENHKQTLREEPLYIVVGEVRDAEEMKQMMLAMESGHMSKFLSQKPEFPKDL